MELSLKQSPSMDTNQDPMQAQLALQQRQLEQQQALEKADLRGVTSNGTKTSVKPY